MAIIINGESIPDDLLSDEFQRIKAHYEQMGRVSCCDRDAEFRAYARDNLTARVLISQEAERRYPDIEEAEITEATARLLAEHGGREAFIERMGLLEHVDEIIRADVLAGLRVDRLLTEAWGREEEFSGTARQGWYEAHVSDFLTDEEVRATHIFKNVERVEDREAVYQFLRSLRQRALAGEDFEAMALAHTDKEDKLTDLGWFRRGEFMEEFDFIIFSLEENEVSPVFASHWGFHMAKVTGRRPRAARPFLEVEHIVAESMRAEARQSATQALVDELKRSAVIEVATAEQ